MGCRVGGSNPGRGKRFSRTVQIGSGAHLAYYSTDTGFFSGGKWPGLEIHHSPPTAEVKNEWSYNSAPPICLHSVDKDNFTFFLPFNYIAQNA